MEPASVLLSVVVVVFTALIVYLNHRRTVNIGKRNKKKSASGSAITDERLLTQKLEESDILKKTVIDPVSRAQVDHDSLPYFPSHETFCSKSVLIMNTSPKHVENTDKGMKCEIHERKLNQINGHCLLQDVATESDAILNTKVSSQLRETDPSRKGGNIKGFNSSKKSESDLANGEDGNIESIIPINVTDVASEEQSSGEATVSQNGAKIDELEVRDGYEFLSLLSPRKDKDDDETSSIGYPEIDIDPDEANTRYPIILIEKMTEEQFVSIRATKKGSEIIREHRILFLIGDPGSGKTACAVNIIKMNKGNTVNDKLCTNKIYNSFRQYEADDSPGNFQLVFFDDCFSQVDFENSQHMDDAEAFLGNIMRTRMKCEDIAFMFTIESKTWNTVLAKFHRILSHLTYAIIDLSDGYLALNSEESEGILRWQISRTNSAVVQYFKDENLHPAEGHRINISEKTISTILRTNCKDDVGFPELCVLMCMNMNRVRGIHDIGIFRFPRSYIFSHLEGMAKSINNDERMGICILLYTAAKNGCFDKYNINIDLMDMITERVVKDRLDLRSGMRALKNGMLVRLSRSKYIIQHSILQDVLSEYIEQNGILS